MKSRVSSYRLGNPQAGNGQGMLTNSFLLTAIHNDRCETWLRLSPSTQTNHLTPKKLEWMNTYLLDCQEGRHSEMCCPSTDRIDVDIFPTRLVDVRGAVPRLIYGSQVISSVSKGRLELPKYAALSYCWGTMSSKEGQLKTEIASEPKFLTEIPKSSMTKTIADAVQLTQALQIPYLWIDALCIIQDNINDWERESSRMGQVYANAFVTFCSLGPSCPSSFLKPQPLRIIIPFQSSLNSAVNGVYVLRYYTCRIAGTVAVTSGLSDVNNSRWLERGWTHQEFVMSPRLLIFGPSFVHFLCPSLTASENKQFTDAVFGQWQFLLRGVSTDRSELYDEWGASIVPIYSDKLFSKPEDVLPAISGLAKHFADATQDEYVVGLWKRDIVRGLMWSYCLSPGPPLMGLNKLLAQFNSPSFYIAPSWSWIGRRSVELDLYRRHDCQYRDFQPEIDIMVTVAIKGQNPFGRIGNAELRITSKVYTLPSTSNLSTTQDGAFWKLRLRDGTSISCTFDWRIPPKLAKLKGHFKLLVLGTVDWTVVRKRTMNRKISKSTGRQGINNSPPIPDHDVYGLLIHTARQKGKFHRVGMFHSYSREQGLQLLDICKMETICLI